MKGVVFAVVRDVVTEAYGDDAWDDVLAGAGVDGAYTSLGSYPDAELVRLVVAASELTGLPVDDVVRLVGRRGFPLLVAHAPYAVARFPSWTTLLLGLDDVIHPEVRKLYPDADMPDFASLDAPPGMVRLRYTSRRGLCRLAEGLILGAGDHYGTTLEVVHETCRASGDTACDLAVQEVAR